MAVSPIATLAAVGDLSGNWSWTVWLLVPAIVLLGLITALCVGPHGEPPRAERGTRGVSQYLERHALQEEDR
ncbi:MAG: hypothetical protein H0X61_04240 [Acidimicrobiia bacterium]|jgi:hypothetical protein|nr:hypothetical protein [Acidimicrobiia bacterium]MBA3982731.1 hypothetical protein [Acidimicrobiia bacterium]MDQ3294731.1 hypothetical protein [Actinomycetota bacterium]MDQ3390968.1 hypothetical protein [Actinomycetota bacterium]